MGLDIDIRPEFEKRTVELEGGTVRRVEAFAEFVQQSDQEVSFDHVVEYLVERVLSESEAGDYLAYRRWCRGGEQEPESAETVDEEPEGADTAESAAEESWNGETGEMTRPVEASEGRSEIERDGRRRRRRDT